MYIQFVFIMYSFTTHLINLILSFVIFRSLLNGTSPTPKTIRLSNWSQQWNPCITLDRKPIRTKLGIWREFITMKFSGKMTCFSTTMKVAKGDFMLVEKVIATANSVLRTSIVTISVKGIIPFCNKGVLTEHVLIQKQIFEWHLSLFILESICAYHYVHAL